MKRKSFCLALGESIPRVDAGKVGRLDDARLMVAAVQRARTNGARNAIAAEQRRQLLLLLLLVLLLLLEQHGLRLFQHEAVRQVETEAAQVQHVVDVQLQLQPRTLRRRHRVTPALAAPSAAAAAGNRRRASRRVRLRYVTALALWGAGVGPLLQLANRKRLQTDLRNQTKTLSTPHSIDCPPPPKKKTQNDFVSQRRQKGRPTISFLYETFAVQRRIVPPLNRYCSMRALKTRSMPGNQSERSAPKTNKQTNKQTNNLIDFESHPLGC